MQIHSCKPLQACKLLHANLCVQFLHANPCVQILRSRERSHRNLFQPHLYFHLGWSGVKHSRGIPRSLWPHVSAGLPPASHPTGGMLGGTMTPPSWAKPLVPVPKRGQMLLGLSHCPAGCTDIGKQRRRWLTHATVLAARASPCSSWGRTHTKIQREIHSRRHYPPAPLPDSLCLSALLTPEV